MNDDCQFENPQDFMTNDVLHCHRRVCLSILTSCALGWRSLLEAADNDQCLNKIDIKMFNHKCHRSNERLDIYMYSYYRRPNTNSWIRWATAFNLFKRRKLDFYVFRCKINRWRWNVHIDVQISYGFRIFYTIWFQNRKYEWLKWQNRP